LPAAAPIALGDLVKIFHSLGHGRAGAQAAAAAWGLFHFDQAHAQLRRGSGASRDSRERRDRYHALIVRGADNHFALRAFTGTPLISIFDQILAHAACRCALTRLCPP